MLTLSGSLPTDASQGVHSLTDVPVYASGPCSEIFGGTYGNIDVFYKIAECLGLSQVPAAGEYGQMPVKGKDNWGKYEKEKEKYGYHHYSEKAPMYCKENGSK